MCHNVVNKALIILFLAGLAQTSVAKEELPEVTVDGLHRVHDSKMAIVYAESGADLATYDSVMLLDAHVAFKKNWERDQRRSSTLSTRLSSTDIEKIKNNLATGFDKVFRETLVEGGYPVVDAAGDNVLLIRPAIINLDITAPDKLSASRSRTFSNSAGQMSLYVELYDSVTGDLIAKALDQKMDKANSSFYTWSNSVTNKAAANKILKGWANILLSALNEAKSETKNEEQVTPELTE